MPNWCCTSYIATGDRKEVRDLYEKMKSLEEGENPLVENGFGKTWLGNLVVLLGGDWHNMYCRGFFSYYQIDDDNETLRFDAITAWSEMRDLRQFIQSKYPSLCIYFRSEEPGMGYFITNDADGEYFPERIEVDDWENGQEYYETWDEVFQVIAEKTGAEVFDREEMNRVLKAYNEKHEHSGICIYEFTVTDS